RKLERRPNLQVEYAKFMREYEAMEHIPRSSPQEFYINKSLELYLMKSRSRFCQKKIFVKYVSDNCIENKELLKATYTTIKYKNKHEYNKSNGHVDVIEMIKQMKHNKHNNTRDLKNNHACNKTIYDNICCESGVDGEQGDNISIQSIDKFSNRSIPNDSLLSPPATINHHEI
ncbi:hypothetical protein PV325_000389, partial [Microctonus aethiopoides]